MNFKKDANNYDQFFISKYKRLLMETNSICHHCDNAEDILHDVYVKLRTRILVSGFTGNHHAYTWQSLRNEFRMDINKKNKTTIIDIDDYENHSEDIQKAEEVLLLEDQWNKAQEQYFESIQAVVMVLFNFIESKYNDQQTYLFKTYFLMGDTYEQLSKRTGINKTKISQTIKPMKRYIRENFNDYVKEYMKKNNNYAS